VINQTRPVTIVAEKDGKAVKKNGKTVGFLEAKGSFVPADAVAFSFGSLREIADAIEFNDPVACFRGRKVFVRPDAFEGASQVELMGMLEELGAFVQSKPSDSTALIIVATHVSSDPGWPNARFLTGGAVETAYAKLKSPTANVTVKKPGG